MAQTHVSAASDATFTEFNIKQDSGVPHFVRLHDKATAGLEAQRQTMMAAGGVLFGTIEAGETCAITVQDFEPITCEHRSGVRAPAVDCSSQCFEKGIRRIKTNGRRDLTAVGYYRPAQRGEFGLEREDREWIKKHFAQHDSLLLVLKPDDRLDLGVFYLGVGGLLLQDRSTVEFPVSVQELCGAPAAAAVPVAAGLAASSAGSPSVTMPATGDARAVASSGRFSIVRKAALTAALLLGGGSAFRALRPQVGEEKIPETPPVAAVGKPARATRPSIAPSAAAAVPPAQKPVSAPKTVTPAAPAPATRTAAFATSSPTSPATSAARAPETPVAAAVSTESAPAVPSTNQPAPAPTATDPPVRTAAPQTAPERPAPGPVEQRNSQPAPAVASNTTSTPAPVAALPVIAPRAVHREAPLLPAALKRRINGVIQIHIQVDVDAAGKVVRAISLTKGDSLTNQLSGLAVESARRWQFDAATQGGQRVSSQAKLEFRFQQ